ncbi:hypothetical protein HDU83_004285 [Entophlyctis luteolus]|nr:hypothetical protein HDU83_004285 [Entophlyctis luteolus]
MRGENFGTRDSEHGAENTKTCRQCEDKRVPSAAAARDSVRGRALGDVELTLSEMGQDASTFERKAAAADVHIDLRDFNLLKVVGKGAFGKVRIVQKKSNGKYYALKYINKLQTIRMRAIQNIFRERCILEDINHPLIVNLRYAFQDDFHMFMVLDLMEGGDLRFHLDKHHGFSEAIIRSWAAEIVYAIWYLHSKNILHRDLKPDNVLLDSEGHAHLTDFNIAVNFSDKRMLKSHSGTLAYMAPDILNDKGYMWQIDWFSLGVILYELFYGKRPFRASTNSELAKLIKTGKFVFHDCNQVTKQPLRISAEFRDLLSGLLDVDRTTRLGCGPTGGKEIMRHPFFEGVVWDDVSDKRTTPLFVPDISKSNFDATLEKDEVAEDEAYLRYRPKQRKNRTAMTQELLQQNASSNPPGGPKPSASLANFLNASPLAGNPAPGAVSDVPQNSASILQVTQLLSLAQIKDVREADPKAPNTERVEAELDFIDENYDPYDWEVAERYAIQQKMQQQQQQQHARDQYENGNNGFGERFSDSLSRARSFGSLKMGGGTNTGGTLRAVGSIGNSGGVASGAEYLRRGRRHVETPEATGDEGYGQNQGAGAQVQQFFGKMRRKSLVAVNRMQMKGEAPGGVLPRQASLKRDGNTRRH